MFWSPVLTSHIRSHCQAPKSHRTITQWTQSWQTHRQTHRQCILISPHGATVLQRYENICILKSHCHIYQNLVRPWFSLQNGIHSPNPSAAWLLLHGHQIDYSVPSHHAALETTFPLCPNSQITESIPQIYLLTDHTEISFFIVFIKLYICLCSPPFLPCLFYTLPSTMTGIRSALIWLSALKWRAEGERWRPGWREGRECGQLEAETQGVNQHYKARFIQFSWMSPIELKKIL